MSADSATARWFPPGESGPSASKLMFCLPHAGGGASEFRAWQTLLGPTVEVVPVRLPGREMRFAEPAARSLTELSDVLAAPVAQRAGPRLIVLFGHSMGALIAYELSQRLRCAGVPQAALIVSGCSAPHLPRRRTMTRGKPIDDMSDAELLEHVRSMQRTPEELLMDEGMSSILLSIIRNDYAACETYSWAERERLSIPIFALGGVADQVSAAELARWSDLTNAETCVRTFPGGHFYFDEQLAEVLAFVGAAVGSL